MVTAAIGRAQGVPKAGPAAALGMDPAMEGHLCCSLKVGIMKRQRIAVELEVHRRDTLSHAAPLG
jgi:hypothetical protein